jgi:hypothetical protein
MAVGERADGRASACVPGGVGVTLPRLITQWPVEWRDAYQERAAHMEYDGNLERGQAERAAERDVRGAAGLRDGGER